MIGTGSAAHVVTAAARELELPSKPIGDQDKTPNWFPRSSPPSAQKWRREREINDHPQPLSSMEVELRGEGRRGEEKERVA